MNAINPRDLPTVQVDILWTKLPKSYYALNPTTYRDGTCFYCMLGDDPAQVIFGWGDTPEEAVREWDCHLNELLRDKSKNSELIQHLRTVFGALPANA